jgi:hypothetical protein
MNKAMLTEFDWARAKAAYQLFDSVDEAIREMNTRIANLPKGRYMFRWHQNCIDVVTRVMPDLPEASYWID